MEYSVTAWRSLSRSLGAEKNGMRCLRPVASELLRQAGPSHPGPVVRQQAGVPGGGAAAGGVPELRQGEAREAGLARGQSVLHQTPVSYTHLTLPTILRV